MRLVAGFPASPGTPLNGHAGVGHLTPMDEGWLLGLVFEVDRQRLVANHLVARAEVAPSGVELAERMRAVGTLLGAASTVSKAARHVLDAVLLLDDFVRDAGPGELALSTRQLGIACRLLGADLETTVHVSAVAEACAVSEGHFRRAFRACMGLSPQQWRQEQRIRFCRKQLVQTDEPLAAIARRAGFAAQSHFSRVFTQMTGMSPSEWRRIVRPSARARNFHDS